MSRLHVYIHTIVNDYETNIGGKPIKQFCINSKDRVVDMKALNVRNSIEHSVIPS